MKVRALATCARCTPRDRSVKKRRLTKSNTLSFNPGSEAGAGGRLISFHTFHVAFIKCPAQMGAHTHRREANLSQLETFLVAKNHAIAITAPSESIHFAWTVAKKLCA